MARLCHPNIIRMVASEEVGNSTALYMELADGGTLFSRVTSTAAGALMEAEAVRSGRQTSDPLE